MAQTKIMRRKIIEKIEKVWTDPEKKRFLIVRTAGNFMILFALSGTILTFGPLIKSEARYRYERATGVEYEVVGNEIVRRYKEREGKPLSNLLARDKDRKKTISPISTEFGIVIPKIGANARVIENVNAADEDEYLKALLKGVAHAKGTGFPGRGYGEQKTRLSTDSLTRASPGGTSPARAFHRAGPASDSLSQNYREKSNINRKIYLFAHSTDNWWNVNRYNAVFFLLKELEPGDEIDLFYRGRRHVYRSTEKLIVKADDVEYLVEPSSEETLILQTCWPPGTTIKRLIIVAKPQRGFADENID